jgi:hypothetical protein
VKIVALQAEVEEIAGRTPLPAGERSLIVVDEDGNKFEIVDVVDWAGHVVLQVRPDQG